MIGAVLRGSVRADVVAVVVVAVLAAAGFGYERLARLGDAERYPPPGREVEVDGNRFHLLCTGSGSPTIVLEAGLGESALGWAAVQRALTGEMRVCSYDRAGMAWSEASAATPRS